MLRRTFLGGLPLAAQAAAPARLRVYPERPFPGSPVLFVRPTGPATGTWMGRTITFAADPESGLWTALAAVGLETKPGPQRLALKGEAPQTIPIAAHAYRTGKLTVAPKFVSPPKAVAKRIEEEREQKKQAFASRTTRVWTGRFVPPTRTAQTSPFGTRRTYNGKTQSIHQGLDFRAAPGTAVLASNRGRVVIAREMYFEGGFVALDHGEGIFTLYMHLSEFQVKEGEAVEKGQTMALSGGTGRVTGPHLHFGVQWQGLYMEPATLLQLRATA